MSWYALFVQQGKEKQVTEYLFKFHPNYHVLLPKRYLTEKRGGEYIGTIKLLFPGYIFIQLDSKLNFKKYYELRELPFLHRMLNYNTQYLKKELNIKKRLNTIKYYEVLKSEEFQCDFFKEINEEDLFVITSLLDEDQIVQPSKINKHESKLEVISGPLLGKESLIKKIDKRKHKVKVMVSLLNEERCFYVDGTIIDQEGK